MKGVWLVNVDMDVDMGVYVKAWASLPCYNVYTIRYFKFNTTASMHT